MLCAARSNFQKLWSSKNRIRAVIVGLDEADALFKIEIAYSLRRYGLQIRSGPPQIVNSVGGWKFEDQTRQQVLKDSFRDPLRELRRQYKGQAVVSDLGDGVFEFSHQLLAIYVLVRLVENDHFINAVPGTSDQIGHYQAEFQRLRRIHGLHSQVENVERPSLQQIAPFICPLIGKP